MLAFVGLPGSMSESLAPSTIAMTRAARSENSFVCFDVLPFAPREMIQLAR